MEGSRWGMYRTGLQSTRNAGEFTVPGGCTRRSKSDPRESLEVFTKKKGVVSPMSGPGL